MFNSNIGKKNTSKTQKLIDQKIFAKLLRENILAKIKLFQKSVRTPEYFISDDFNKEYKENKIYKIFQQLIPL